MQVQRDRHDRVGARSSPAPATSSSRARRRGPAPARGVRPGTGFAALVTRQTPLSANGVRTSPGGSPRAEVAADHAGVDDPAGGVGDPGRGPAADEREARRAGVRAAVEVREVGEHRLGDARAAHRDRRLARAAAGSASAREHAATAAATTRRRAARRSAARPRAARRAAGQPARVMRRPRARGLTPRLPARSAAHACAVAVASGAPGGVERVDPRAPPAALQRDRERRAARRQARDRAAVEADAVALDRLRRARSPRPGAASAVPSAVARRIRTRGGCVAVVPDRGRGGAARSRARRRSPRRPAAASGRACWSSSARRSTALMPRVHRDHQRRDAARPSAPPSRCRTSRRSRRRWSSTGSARPARRGRPSSAAVVRVGVEAAAVASGAVAATLIRFGAGIAAGYAGRCVDVARVVAGGDDDERVGRAGGGDRVVQARVGRVALEAGVDHPRAVGRGVADALGDGAGGPGRRRRRARGRS